MKRRSVCIPVFVAAFASAAALVMAAAAASQEAAKTPPAAAASQEAAKTAPAAAADASGVKTARLSDVKWQPGPFPGSRIAVLAGDPKQGMHHAYLELADGAHIAPHWHSSGEYVTVVSGTMLLGVGEKAVHDQTRLYGPGAFVFMPPGTPHYGWAKGKVVLSQTRSGAADVHWVNPADDPAQMKAKDEAARKE